MVHNLLEDSLLSYRGADRRRQRASLPGILARLAAGEIEDFPRVRRHQLDPWCMFLTQLAAIALDRAGDGPDPRRTEDEWRTLLLQLTGDRHEPWALVVDDLSLPAFLQTPVPEASLVRWSRHAHPDDLDILVTAKAHDVKTGLVDAGDVEAWALSLVTLQTMQGYPGRGYNRVARMKGGYGSRGRVGLAQDLSLGARFSRDVEVLSTLSSRLSERGFDPTGIGLVWTESWDGTTSLPISRLAPHFIEVCWRVRLLYERGAIACAYTTTNARRCAPEIDTGDVGDAWIPIERTSSLAGASNASGGALTVGPRGLDYRLLARLILHGDFEPAPAQVPLRGDDDRMLFLASALSRGQGKTEGFHERTVILPGGVQLRLGVESERLALQGRAQQRIERASTMRAKVLFPALRELAQGGPLHQDEFDERVDDVFFEHLFESLDIPDPDAAIAFDRLLIELGRQELASAMQRVGLSGARRYKAISAAERMLDGCLRKWFRDAVDSITAPRPAQGVHG